MDHFRIVISPVHRRGGIRSECNKLIEDALTIKRRGSNYDSLTQGEFVIAMS